MTEPIPSPYTNFERIPAEEQQRILEACIEEFAQNGYEAASTNAIVKRAGIPKGTLFYFFGSKKDLYLYVIDHAVSRFVSAFEQIHVETSTDLFERLIQHGNARMQFVVQNPLLYRFFYRAFINAPDEIQAELQKRYAAYAQESRRRLTDGLDRSKFREGVAVDQAIELVNLVIEGLYSRYLPAFQRLSPAEALKLVEKITAETHLYFEMLKKGVYKNL